MNNTLFTSFSVLGMGIILTVGGLMITVNLCIENLVRWYQQRRDLDPYGRLEWCINSTLQLQRVAHEGLGYGTWSSKTATNPTTMPGEELAVLDTKDPKHPMLRTT